MRLKFNTYTLTLLLCAAFLICLIGCASQSEKEERQQNAFDISGDYTPLTQSSSQLAFKIRNESGRHDIRIEISRDQLPQAELEGYQKYNLDSAKIKTLTGNPLVVGEGFFKDDPAGGENISDDFGETSRVSLSKRIQYDATTQLTYSFSALIRKNEFVLRGTFSVSMNSSTTYNTIASFSFECQNGTQFFQQYFGAWSGTVYLKDINAKTLAAVKNFQLERSTVNPDLFTVRPTIQTLPYQGKDYVFQEKPHSVQSLASQSYPSIEIRFVAPDSSRLVFFGNLFSLGNLSGSVVNIDGSTEETVANFQFKKD